MFCLLIDDGGDRKGCLVLYHILNYTFDMKRSLIASENVDSDVIS